MKSLDGEKKYLGRDSSPQLEVASLRDNILVDADGKSYIDFVMGWCVGNLGWGDVAIAGSADTFNGPDYIFPDYAYRPWVTLAELLASIAPGNLTKCFRATGGSEAVDLALQAAMIHTGRGKFLSFEGSYHGNTLAALSIGDSENREQCPNLLRNCGKIEPPLDGRAIGKIETQLKRRDVAAFIFEPISINLGVRVPDVDDIKELQRLCRKYGTLLIADEVASGFGRTGRMFACDHFGLQPDMMCVAKAMTGGFAPIGALLTTPSVGRSFEKVGSFYSTYGWHPRSVDVAIKTIRYLKSNEGELLSGMAEISEYIRIRLEDMFDERAEVRVCGLAVAVDVGDEGRAEKLQERCQRNGLLVSVEGSAILLLPALTIDRATAARGLDILADSTH